MKKPGYIFWSAIGFVLVIGAVLIPASVPSRLAFAVVGAALLYTRGPGKADAPGHDKRKFFTLRAEVDDFIDTVRRVNTAAESLNQAETPEARREFESSCEELVARAEHIGMLTWRENAELVEGRPEAAG